MKRLLFLLIIIFTLVETAKTSEEYVIYPIPQKVQWNNEFTHLTREINIVCDSELSPLIKARIEEVFENNQFTFVYSSQLNAGKTNLLIGRHNSNDPADQYVKNNNLPTSVFDDANNKFDPYLLQVSSGSKFGDILILGDQHGSAYYALATLEQILEKIVSDNIRQGVIEDFAYTKYRGIVEGFYGHPWSMENRLSLLDYCKRYKMNVYVYGPKSDPYHLGQWADDYPTAISEEQRYFGLITQQDISVLAKKAISCNVDFIWAAHPGMSNGISFSSIASVNQGLARMMNKFDHLYKLGIRGFGVFLDDMNYTPSGNMAAYLIQQTHAQLKEKYNGNEIEANNKVAPLFYVPTQYALNYGTNTLTQLKDIDPEIVVAFTGHDCFSTIRPSSIESMANLIGKNPVMWWNNPVNDDHDDRIYMRELTMHWDIESQNPISTLHGLLLNPMNQAQASKVALFGGADYAWNPAHFDASVNWEYAIKSIIRGDSNKAAALRTFALNSNSLNEYEKLIPLYAQFIEGYTDYNLPSVTEELITEMDLILTSCQTIQSFAKSSDYDEFLLYQDIKCWVNKLESMAMIIGKTLRLMKQNETSSWTDFLIAKEAYEKLHTDSAFFVSVFEGAGNTTTERYTEAKPSSTHMEPFVDFLIARIDKYAPQLPLRKTDPLIISNKELPAHIILRRNYSSLDLSGLNGLSLAKGEYIGVFLNTLKQLSLEQIPAEFLTDFSFEYSENGKQWTTYVPTTDLITMAYVRIKNITSIPLIIKTDTLSIDLPTENVPLPIVSTNMSIYQQYNVNNVIDGNPASFMWKNGPQAIGDYILLDYGEPVYINEIKLIFNQGDYITGTANIEVSYDNIIWESVKELTSGEIEKNRTSLYNASNKQARYIRLIITSVNGGNWFQLAEFAPVCNKEKIIAPVSDQDGAPVYSLTDNNLMSGYFPQTAGELYYRFIENINIDQIKLYHYSQFNSEAAYPTIELLVNNQWEHRGTLHDPITLLETGDLKLITQMRITWTNENIPKIYELLPLGTPYIEPSDSIDTSDKVLSLPECKIWTDKGRIKINSITPIKRVKVYDSKGTVCYDYIADQTNVTNIILPDMLTYGHVYFIRIYLQDGTYKVQKIIS
ncbi:MAG: beta-N-acetylglucosaminidase domain-containing protein [Bacteroidales bacterium]